MWTIVATTLAGVSLAALAARIAMAPSNDAQYEKIGWLLLGSLICGMLLMRGFADVLRAVRRRKSSVLFRILIVAWLAPGVWIALQILRLGTTDLGEVFLITPAPACGFGSLLPSAIDYLLTAETISAERSWLIAFATVEGGVIAMLAINLVAILRRRPASVP